MTQRILVFGDSNTARPEKGGPAWTELLEKNDPDSFIILNEGCEGRTVCHDIGERNGVSAIIHILAKHAPLDYTAVMLGTNDVKNSYGPPTTEEIIEGVLELFEHVDLHGGGARPILLTPPPIGAEVDGDLSDGHVRVDSLAKQYRALAMERGIRFVNIHAIIDVDTDLEPDKVHLNDRGRQKVAGAVRCNLKIFS